MGLLPRRTASPSPTTTTTTTTTTITTTTNSHLLFRSLASLSYAESQQVLHQLNEKMDISVTGSSLRRPSRPVVIPTARSSGVKRGATNHHRHGGIPPAVAALLAVTAIPLPGSRKQRVLREQGGEEGVLDIFVEPPTPTHHAHAHAQTRTHHHPLLPFDDDDDDDDDISSEEENLAVESVELSRDPSRDSIRSALSVLLSPPDEYEGCTSSRLEKSPSDSQLSLRSSSTESVPSLDADDESTLSWGSVYSSPMSRRRSSNDPARFRGLASPPEDCHYDHPLMWEDSDDEVSKIPTLEPAEGEGFGCFTEDAVKRITRRLNFKSNLTASIRVLKSAARSFSSISVSTPLIQPDDYLTRSILSITPQFTDEKRPATTCLDTPTPALRRYLNPTNPVADSPCTGAIQMQTYHCNRNRPSSSSPPLSLNTTENKTCDSASGSNSSNSNSNSGQSHMIARPREVRENGDFLRVIVLEMNMRREGKLADSAQGKARLVLPPRQPCRYRALGDPGRWKASVCVYD